MTLGSSIRGILFDLDETLYSREAAFWTWVESEAALADAGAALDREAVAALDRRGRGDKSKLLRYLGDTLEWREGEPERLERFRAGIGSAVRLDSDVRKMLERLAGSYHLGLVTNGTAETQRAKLARLDVDHLFDPIVISGEVGFRKPDAGIFELAVAGWKVPRHSVLFVGDDPVTDVQGARDSGMRALQVGSENGIRSLLELEAWLRRVPEQTSA